ncbi:conserved hypothetical protein [Neospora caninum Liverpool]|uniref:START-2 domain protein n=1 Tax=Neospora caninum (strain Liverpool) TaxID=572307 RepID=F0V952_NEOCL|nr:conserved hypothetical protein [Neospora caninum Liverpool]CBZ50277.1 conserved hypothetical protein [Neospora caninum Liverpool]CEL64882.1 TPA: hypothetical protein BN1204_007510 [Neospora caninum Liverpool]|eukprot:XP_003880311.1 conserved hypothetical protein [Neospora caninum Liverpool]
MPLSRFICRKARATAPQTRHAPSQLPSVAPKSETADAATCGRETEGPAEDRREGQNHAEIEKATSGTNGAAPISTAESDGVTASPASNQPLLSSGVSAERPDASHTEAEKEQTEDQEERKTEKAENSEASPASPSPRLIPPEGAAEASRPTPDLASSKGEEGLGVRTGEKDENAAPSAEGASSLPAPNHETAKDKNAEKDAEKNVEKDAEKNAEENAEKNEDKSSEASSRAAADAPGGQPAPREKRDSLLSASEHADGACVGCAGEESGRRRSGVGEQRTVSLEEILERKMKKLEAYMEEEQLFKAFSYVLLLEHQIDHRLAILNATLGLPSVAGPSLASLFPPGERFPDERRGDERKLEESEEVLSALRPGSFLPSSLLLKKQEDLRSQRESLLAFANRLASSQQLKNLCFEMRWAFQMLGNFHLDHLRQVCEEPRLSVCDSFCSLPRSASCASQSSTFSYFGKTGGEKEREERGEQATGASAPAAKGSRDLSGRLSISGGVAGERGDTRDEDSMAAGSALPERKLSTTKIKQGFRNMSRKMSLSRKSSAARRASVKKIITAKKVQDDEGWIREKGRYLDLAYRVEKDSSVSIKVRGKLPCPLFEVLSILNETDLAGTWAPFFKSAEREVQYTKASQLVRQVYDYPLLGAKETLMFCVGINALEEAGCVIIFCRSPPENAAEFLGQPVPEKRKLLRIQSADLVFLLYPIAEGRQTTLELYGRFQHGLRFVPMKIITFVVKKVVRGMFVAIARQCQCFQSGPYKERVQNNPAFYSWMRNKIEDFVQQQKQGTVRNAETISLASFNYEDFQD